MESLAEQRNNGDMPDGEEEEDNEEMLYEFSDDEEQRHRQHPDLPHLSTQVQQQLLEIPALQPSSPSAAASRLLERRPPSKQLMVEGHRAAHSPLQAAADLYFAPMVQQGPEHRRGQGEPTPKKAQPSSRLSPPAGCSPITHLRSMSLLIQFARRSEKD